MNVKLSTVTAISLLAASFSTTLYANDTDPLTPVELEKALAISTPVSTKKTRNRNSASGNEIANELLLVERRLIDKEQTPQRLADVYHYDYDNNETIHTIVNLDTQKVISTRHHQRLQLPLNENELQRSSDIIFTDSEQSALIKNEYQRITGKYLSSPEQLNIKAFVFSADTLSEELNPASQQCGLHRCAQILLYTHDSIVFEISPIVNLSAGIVTQNIGY